MPSSRTISVNGLDFFVVEQGQGPLVLLCHGWSESAIAELADRG
jgi:pimeloyl-ACP methyl ester carboxylesterase